MRTLLLVPSSHDSGLTAVCLGLIRAFQRQGANPGYFKPIAQPKGGDASSERSTELVKMATDLNPPTPMPREEAEALLKSNDDESLMEKVVERHQQVVAKGHGVIVVEGLVLAEDLAYANRVNSQIASTLDAEVIMVGRSSATAAEGFEIMSTNFGKGQRISGCILNKVKLDGLDQSYSHQALLSELESENLFDTLRGESEVQTAAKARFPMIGAIPFRPQIVAPRVYDIYEELNLTLINDGEWKSRRVFDVSLCGRNIPEVLDAFTDGRLIIVPMRRYDVLLAACSAFLNGAQIAGIILSGETRSSLNSKVMKLCRPAMERGLPILSHKDTSLDTALAIKNRVPNIPLNDPERLEEIMNFIANYVDLNWVKTCGSVKKSATRLSPPAFRHNLINAARQANKRVVLPEGDEIRTIQAAAICVEKEIARCVLLAEPDTVKRVAREAGILLPEGLEIVDPSQLVSKYVDGLVELRKHKGMTVDIAERELQDTVVLGTMMLKEGDVDGLVSGAVHTTANTIRPALQLIKTRPDADLVSSIFFMCLPDQVLVYGDCAVNPDPSAEQLASIAIDATDSAKAFGIPARTAMISYSTGQSGSGDDVDKVRQATEIVKAKRADILVDGPLQYDAATELDVAKKKAPESQVAGDATVLVFPDLNTGNTTYKAVQRSANVVSIGPMLQGLAKPVNDLSRGALVEDIVYTIALTAIQATQS